MPHTDLSMEQKYYNVLSMAESQVIDKQSATAAVDALSMYAGPTKTTGIKDANLAASSLDTYKKASRLNPDLSGESYEQAQIFACRFPDNKTVQEACLDNFKDLASFDNSMKAMARVRAKILDRKLHPDTAHEESSTQTWRDVELDNMKKQNLKRKVDYKYGPKEDLYKFKGEMEKEY